MPCMLTSAPAFDTLASATLIQAQPQLAARVHAGLDMVTVLDLLYGCTDALPSHVSAHAINLEHHVRL